MRRGWLVLLLALSGCVHWELPPVSDRSIAARGSDWLSEAREVQQMPAHIQPEELQRRQQVHKYEDTAVSGLRLVLLLTLGVEAVRDEARALEVLNGIDATHLDVSQLALADLLGQMSRERQQAKALRRAERKVLAEQEARIRELETQLEAVTSIEQSIRQRQKPLQGVEP
ncbi:MAG: hypothetical protein OQK27_01915 [Gammaproteobacteria bacterium]|nr:hypothetical protein [Gammaproteobacteria bacterium]